MLSTDRNKRILLYLLRLFKIDGNGGDKRVDAHCRYSVDGAEITPIVWCQNVRPARTV